MQNVDCFQNHEFFTYTEKNRTSQNGALVALFDGGTILVH